MGVMHASAACRVLTRSVALAIRRSSCSISFFEHVNDAGRHNEFIGHRTRSTSASANSLSQPPSYLISPIAHAHQRRTRAVPADATPPGQPSAVYRCPFVSLVALLAWRDLLLRAKHLLVAAIGRRRARRAAARPRRPARARPAARWCGPVQRPCPAALNCAALARGCLVSPRSGHPGAVPAPPGQKRAATKVDSRCGGPWGRLSPPRRPRNARPRVFRPVLGLPRRFPGRYGGEAGGGERPGLQGQHTSPPVMGPFAPASGAPICALMSTRPSAVDLKFLSL